MKYCLLSQLRPGQECTLHRFLVHKPVYSRLMDMGLRGGGAICCAAIAPSGSPIALWIKDTLIALRADDCKNIEVMI